MLNLLLAIFSYFSVSCFFLLDRTSTRSDSRMKRKSMWFSNSHLLFHLYIHINVLIVSFLSFYILHIHQLEHNTSPLPETCFCRFISNLDLKACKKNQIYESLKSSYFETTQNIGQKRHTHIYTYTTTYLHLRFFPLMLY